MSERQYFAAHVRRRGDRVLVHIEGVGQTEAGASERPIDVAQNLVRHELGLQPGTYALSITYAEELSSEDGAGSG